MFVCVLTWVANVHGWRGLTGEKCPFHIAIRDERRDTDVFSFIEMLREIVHFQDELYERASVAH